MPGAAAENNDENKDARQRILVLGTLLSYQIRQAEHDRVSIFQCATIRKGISISSTSWAARAARR
jgi:hypothetical protein